MPLVIIKLWPLLTSALFKDHSQPIPFTVILELKAVPLVANVLPVVEPDSVSAPVYVRENVVIGKLALPWIASGAVPAHTICPVAGLPIVSEPQRSCVAVQVTV